jgi:hypothetical protein
MLPPLAVLIRQNLLNDRRLLLLRSGYAEGIGQLDASAKGTFLTQLTLRFDQFPAHVTMSS